MYKYTKSGIIAFVTSVFAWCIFILPFYSYAQEIPLKFSHLTVDNGLSHTDTKDIKQDKLGFIWIATLFGLDRFDGYTIKQFYNNLDPKNNAFRNRIRSICPDDEGKIWLATDAGIQCFDSASGKYLPLIDNTNNNSEALNYTKIIKLKGDKLFALRLNKPYLYTLQNYRLINVSLTVSQALNFYDATTDASGNVWLTGDNSIWLLNKYNQILRKAIVDGTDIGNNHLSKVYLNNRGEILFIKGREILWTTQKTGLPGLNNGKAIHVAIQKRLIVAKGTNISDIIQDHHNRFWVSTDKGLLQLNSNLQLQQTITSKTMVNGLTTNHLEKLFIDRSQCLWMCSFGGGINYLDLNAKLFYTFQHNPDLSNTLSGNHIRCISEENGEKLWIGTNENGLNCYDFRTRKFTLINSSSKPVALKSDVVNSLVFDKKGNLWIGTDKGIEILSKNRLELLYPKGYGDFPGYQIESLAVDYYGNIWFGSIDQSMGVITQNNDVYKVKYLGPGHFIFADQDTPHVFAASTEGIIHLLLDKNSNIIKMVHYLIKDGPNSLSSNFIWPIQKINDNDYWVGTIGGGLDLIHLTQDDGYSAITFGTKFHVFNDVESIQADNHGNIWMGGKGLEKFDPVTKNVTKYDYNDGLQGNSFKVGASLKGKDGRLYFGGINGLNYFHPDSIKINPIPAAPHITDLLINSKRADVGEADSVTNVLKRSICYSNDLSLSYLQNNFVLSFSGMHFANPSKCKFRYKLLGYDKDWKYTDGNNPNAAYSNLDYTNYTFMVEASNNDGVWSHTHASLNIGISPPWWKSTAAKIFYVLLFLSGLTGIYIYQARWYRLKSEFVVRNIEEKKREEIHQQREELYQQQLQFFTNISHEFRTPLTLILGPLEGLVKQNVNSVYQHSYEVMYKNAKRLINLINELMNFRKVADSAIKLRVMPVCLSDFIKEMYEEFNDLALNKEIAFTLTNSDDTVSGWLDPHILEKILFNVLNNAFKYTPAGGHVTLDMFFDFVQYRPVYGTGYSLLSEKRAERYVYFRVADTGAGISKESISQIFDRYYRVSNNHLGSGVGLALVKSLTLLHKGDIQVYSERYKGTEIVIAFPLGEENYLAEEKGINKEGQSENKLEKIDQIVTVPRASTIVELKEEKYQINAKQHILLVEDNDELRYFLKDQLNQHYVVYEGSDGRQGLDVAIDKVPDLIISDVMMPTMNGVELCREIKKRFETSHIPFLILSAKDALEAQLEGLESGADYYFAKPLSTELLLLTIRNIFEQKQKLKAKYTKDYYADATELVHSARDKAFLDKLIALIEANIEVPELDVDYICQNLYVSRTKLYQKIKGISGQSVGEFVRTIRLKKAAYIMTHEDVTLNEVTDRIGIQSVSYFSRAFKKEFGKSPSQFLQSIKTEI
jgi:signal transduction histidine kinase/ligand-binding sensor domain-containing protein/DNA-binding response OmpR family regulator